MLKKDVIDFFNLCASDWDDEMIRDDRIVNIILDNAMVSARKSESRSLCSRQEAT